MQKLEIKLLDVNVEETAKQGKAIFQEVEMVEVVASTKSANNLREGLQEGGKIIKSIKATDFFLDDDCVVDLLAVISEHFGEEIYEKVQTHLLKALQSACMIERK